MTHRLATNYAKNYCNRTSIVKVIVENVVTCFFGTQCIQLCVTVLLYISLLFVIVFFIIILLFLCYHCSMDSVPEIKIDWIGLV